MSLEEKRMTPEEAKTVGRRIVEAINEGTLTTVDELFAGTYVDHSPIPGTTPDLEGLKQGLSAFRKAFPDFRYTIEDEIAVGDKFVQRLSARGTQKGEFQGAPATGKQAVWSEIHIARLLNGKVVEHWGVADELGMMQQLGLGPAMKVPAVR